MTQLYHKKYFWIIILLICFQFFRCLYIPVSNTVSKLFIVIFAIIPMFFYFKKSVPLKKAMFMMLAFLMASCIMGYIYWNQNFIQTFLASFVIYSVFWYFFFWKTKLDLKLAEKVLTYMALIYSISYIIQWIIFPILIFDTQAMSENIFNTRLRLQGTALASIGFCLFYNKILLKWNMKNAIFFFLCFLPIALMGFRTMLVALIICIVFLTIKIKGFNHKLLLPLLALVSIGIILINTKYGQNVIGDIQTRQETDNFQNEDYARIIGLNYYLHDHFHNVTEQILGCGMYYSGSEGEKLQEQLDPYGIKWNDWGILGLSFYSGFITIAILLYCTIACALKRTNKECIYLNTWMIYMLLCSITTAEFLRQGNTIIWALVAYMIIKTNQINRNGKNICNYTNI